jgi:hypothetical protein
VQWAFGCPFRCEFCIDNQLYKKMLYRDVNDVIEELVEIDRLGFREVYFKDLTFGLHRGLAEEFLAKLDNTALSKAVLDLETLSKSGRRLPILVQIHHATVVNARRRAFFVEKVKTVSTERRKLISLEIVECPSNGMTMGFSGFVAAMRGQGVRMAMRVDSDWRDFRGIERSGVSIATTASLPMRESTESLMAPFWIYLTSSAGSPCEKTTSPD